MNTLEYWQDGNGLKILGFIAFFVFTIVFFRSHPY
jgi:hypothetical protein